MNLACRRMIAAKTEKSICAIGARRSNTLVEAFGACCCG
jgi:hypothetical protein